MIETTLDGKTKNITQDNIKQLKQLFPEIITEDKIDFNKLREILGEEVDDTNEKYDFIWNGKHESVKISQTPSEGTLRPSKENSKNWDTTENLYIEGDNLEVLKLLQKSYYGKIKMIYLDPPYNTGKDFVYEDNFIDSLKNYLDQDEEGFNVSSNPETSGRYHTNWLNMIYPRLKLSRNLLTDTGVLFISIDDHEIFDLMNICNEIFGEINCELMIWDKISGNSNAGSGKMKITHRFRKDHEYVLVCYKNKLKTFLNKPLRIKKTKNEYGNQDNDPRGNWISSEICKSEAKSNPDGKNYFALKTPSGKVIERQWHFSLDEIKKLDEDNRIYWGNGEIIPRLKKFVNEPRPTTPSSVINGISQTDGNANLKELGLNFDNPKPVNLINWFIEISTDNEEYVLDFFSGSATTAESVLNVNFNNDKNNRFIMVQLPEKTSEKSDAYKAGYKNICEIGEERIRRAGEKLLKEKPDVNKDIGFKVFKLDSSNLTKWNPNVDNLEDSLIAVTDNIVEGRSELDLVYEIILKYGVELTAPVDELSFDKYNFYSVGKGSLVICLNDHITRDVTEDILKIKEDLSPDVIRVVFKDNGFESDADKTNVKEILRNNEVDEFITI